MTSLLLFIYVCIYSYYKVMLTDDKQFFFIFENEIKQNINLILKLGNLIYISWFQSVLWSHPSTLFFNMFCIGPCCLLI